MEGNIYCREKCPTCGAKLVHDERRGGFFCPSENHEDPKQRHFYQAQTGFYIKFKKVRRESKDYRKLMRWLTAMRFETDQNRFDFRKHIPSNPLAFRKLAKLYIEERKADPLSKAMKRQIENYLGRAIDAWGDTLVTDIKRRDIKHFLRDLTHFKTGKPLSGKTKKNCSDILFRFFSDWCVEEEYLQKYEVPSFPTIKYELGWRKYTDLDTQDEILEALYKMTEHNPKIWFGVELLRTYPTMRPGDLHRVREKDIDLTYGVIDMPKPTKGYGSKKVVRLVEEHIDMFRQFKDEYPAMPDMPFFRHCANGTNYKRDQQMGENCFRRWWNRACKEVGVEGVQLYGGTKHTTTTATAKMLNREAAKAATGHKSDRAFDRYCQTEGQEALAVHEQLVQKRKKSEPKKVLRLGKA